MALFAPSTTIFKLFLLEFLPLILILLAVIVFYIAGCIVKVRNKSAEFDTKRYIVVSAICIVYMLLPNLTFESLTLFQCIQIDDGEYRMKVHKEYGCYSWDHLRWIFIISFPTIAVWVIGMPILALRYLIKQRRNLDQEDVMRYMLMLYQGLKPTVFYWELMNMLRKTLILC